MFGSDECESSGEYDSNEAFEEFLLEYYGLNIDELKLKGVQLNLLLVSLAFESPTSIMKGISSKDFHFENEFNKLLGKEYPTKLNRVKLQPYDPETGQFLSYSKNTGFKLSPISRFSSGFGQGWAEAKGAGGATPVGTAGNIGYMLGRIIGSLF